MSRDVWTQIGPYPVRISPADWHPRGVEVYFADRPGSPIFAAGGMETVTESLLAGVLAQRAEADAEMQADARWAAVLSEAATELDALKARYTPTERRAMTAAQVRQAVLAGRTSVFGDPAKRQAVR